MIRLLGLLILGLGVVIAAADIVAGLQSDQGVELRALGWWWAELHLDSLLLLQPAVERYITPAIWDPGIQTLLEWPAALETMALGAAIWLMGSWLRARARRRAH